MGSSSFYGLEVSHLKPNFIVQIAIFINLCETFLGIAPHFNLWRALYHLRGYPSAACRDVVGSAAFSQRQGRSYPALELRDSNKGWHKEWFVVSNPTPCLSARTGRAPEPRACWEEQLTEEEMVQVDLLLKEIAGLSAQGLTGAVVALSFSRQLVQPIRDRVHPGFEYWGRQDPTRGQN